MKYLKISSYNHSFRRYTRYFSVKVEGINGYIYEDVTLGLELRHDVCMNESVYIEIKEEGKGYGSAIMIQRNTSIEFRPEDIEYIVTHISGKVLLKERQS